MTRSKRSFDETKRAEMIGLGRDVRRRCTLLLAGLPIGSEHYRAVSELLDAANKMLNVLGADDWYGRNTIGQS